MFDRPGIGVEDLPWIQRDQFVHYMHLAHARADGQSWPQLRQDLMRGLAAAFGLDAGHAHGDQYTAWEGGVLELLDKVRHQHDPATEWPAFFDTLWSRRHNIRPDLA